MTNNKYELTNIKYQHFEFTLYQIRALKDFGNIKAGQLGGFVSGYHNLSQNGLSWCYPECFCYINAKIMGDAQAFGGWVWNKAILKEESTCKDSCFIYDSAECFGQSIIMGEACCSGFSKIFDHAIIKDRGAISSNAWAHGKSEISQYARAGGTAELTGTFKLKGNGFLTEGCWDHGVVERWSPYMVNVALHG